MGGACGLRNGFAAVRQRSAPIGQNPGREEEGRCDEGEKKSRTPHGRCSFQLAEVRIEHCQGVECHQNVRRCLVPMPPEAAEEIGQADLRANFSSCTYGNRKAGTMTYSCLNHEVCIPVDQLNLPSRQIPLVIHPSVRFFRNVAKVE